MAADFGGVCSAGCGGALCPAVSLSVCFAFFAGGVLTAEGFALVGPAGSEGGTAAGARDLPVAAADLLLAFALVLDSAETVGGLPLEAEAEGSPAPALPRGFCAARLVKITASNKHQTPSWAIVCLIGGAASHPTNPGSGGR